MGGSVTEISVFPDAVTPSTAAFPVLLKGAVRSAPRARIASVFFSFCFTIVLLRRLGFEGVWFFYFTALNYCDYTSMVY